MCLPLPNNPYSEEKNASGRQEGDRREAPKTTLFGADP